MLTIPGIIKKVGSLLGQSPNNGTQTATPQTVRAVTDPYAKYKNLSEQSLRSMSKEDATSLQQMLIDKGMLSATSSSGRTNADGIIGNRTLEAYNKWNSNGQTQNPVGSIDRSLYKNEADYWKDRTLNGIQNGTQDATDLQNFLIKNGYLSELNAKGKSNADGIIGQGTRDAYNKYIDNYNFYGKGVRSGDSNAAILTDEDAARNERFRNANKPGLNAVSEFVGRNVSPVLGSALKWVGGDNKAIDEGMYSQQDLFNMARMAAEDARNNRPMGVYGNKEYGDYNILGSETDETPAPEGQTFRDGVKSLINKIKNNQASRISRSLGSWAGDFDENGNLVIKDSYDFNARGDANGADDQSKKYGSTYDKIRQRMGTMNRNSIPVNITIPREMYEYALANPDATSYVPKGEGGLKLKDNYEKNKAVYHNSWKNLFNNQNARQFSRITSTKSKEFTHNAGPEYKEALKGFLVRKGYLDQETAENKKASSKEVDTALQNWKEHYNNSIGTKIANGVQSAVGNFSAGVTAPVRILRRAVNTGAKAVGLNGVSMPAVTSIIDHVANLGEGERINNADFTDNQLQEIATAINNAQHDRKINGKNAKEEGSFGYQHYTSGKRLNPLDLVGKKSAEANAQFTLGRANYKLSDDGKNYIVTDHYNFGNSADYSSRDKSFLPKMENFISYLTNGQGRNVKLTIPVERVLGTSKK